MKNLLPALIGVGLVLSGPSAGAQAEKEIQLTIESQELTDALNELAQVAGLRLIGPAAATRSIHSLPLRGTFTPRAALNRLLEGTQLTYEFIDAHTVAIHEQSPSANAPAANPQSRLDHAPKLQLADAAQQVAEGPMASTTESSNSEAITEVIVTGSRLRRRTGEEGPAPVTVFDRERIEQVGASNVADVLNYLPQQSFAANEQNTSGGARIIRLRGLGRGTTLVLINGRRTVTSAILGSQNAFDVNTVPLSAVERIEVLADSASAIYGADAVGGVVNIVLKKDIGRPIADLYFGTAADGAEERRVAASLGHSGERFRASAVLDLFERDFLSGEYRDRYANQDFRRFGASDRRSTISNPGNITSTTAANLPGLPSRFAAVPHGSTGVGLTPASFSATAGQQNLESLGRFQSVIPKAERYSGMATMEFDLADRVTAFGEFSYAHRDDSRLLLPSFLAGTVVPAGNAFNPFGVAVSANYLLEGLGSQRNESESESARAVVGISGDLGSWDWEISALSVDDDGKQFTLNAADPVRVAAALASSDPGQALNVFQDGPGGSTALLNSLLAAPVVDRYASNASQGSAFVRGPLFSMPAGWTEVVLGAEGRSEELLFNSRSLGILVDEDRRSSSIYSELRFPIIGGTMRVPLIERLTVTLAGRYDDYSDFGHDFNPQYGVEWYPISKLLLRASYGTSYRAPSLFELYSPTTTLPQTLLDPRRNNEPTPILVSRGGNPELDPEESDSLTLGFVFTPRMPGQPRIAASYWKVQQDLRVQSFQPALVLANEATFPDRIVRATPTAADNAAGLPGRLVSINATSVNFGPLRAEGVDLDISGRIETAAGLFSPSISATWVGSFEVSDFPNTPALERVGVANSQGTIPKWRATATVAWTRAAFGFSTTARYVSSYADTTSTNVRTGRTVPSQTLLDVQGTLDVGAIAPALDWSRGVTLRIGALNLFDEQPNFSEVGGSLGYDPVQADVRQRFAYVSISKAF